MYCSHAYMVMYSNCICVCMHMCVCVCVNTLISSVVVLISLLWYCIYYTAHVLVLFDHVVVSNSIVGAE